MAVYWPKCLIILNIRTFRNCLERRGFRKSTESSKVCEHSCAISQHVLLWKAVLQKGIKKSNKNVATKYSTQSRKKNVQAQTIESYDKITGDNHKALSLRKDKECPFTKLKTN